MALNGINNNGTNGPLAGLTRPVQQPRTQIPGGQAQPATRPGTAVGAPAKPATVSAPAAGAVLSAEAPAGTDPELWSVLTAAERTFFAKSGAMGPLTYGRIMTGNGAPSAPIGRGGRLDVKV